MGMQAEVDTSFGEKRELYIRLNNVEASNHGVPSRALFRGFLSEAVYLAGGQFMWEQNIEFMADVGAPLWSQAYARLAEHLEGLKGAAALPALDGGIEPALEEAPMEETVVDVGPVDGSLTGEPE